jgi:hypothetical protein
MAHVGHALGCAARRGKRTAGVAHGEEVEELENRK